MIKSRAIAFCCSLLVILPGLQLLEEVSLVKKSKRLDPTIIEYTIKFHKENMQTFQGNPWIKDPLSSKVQLFSYEQTPSAFYLKRKRYHGYPLPQDYPYVTQIDWEIKDHQRFRYPQTNFTFLDAGVYYRKDLFHLPETTLAWEKDYRYGAVMPCTDLVKERQYLFVPSMDGRLTAFHASTGKVFWEVQLPLGEIIDQALVTFEQNKRLIVAAGSNLGNLYLFSGENGATMQKIFLGKPMTAPLHYYSFNKSEGIIAITSDAVICFDLVNYSERWRRINTTGICHSPLSLIAGKELIFILSSDNGSIQALDEAGQTKWQRSMNARMLYAPLAFVQKGYPYVSGALSSKTAFLINAFSGSVIFQRSLPGEPRSPLSVDSTAMSFALMTSDPASEEDSIFFNDHFLTDERLKGYVSLKGKRFLGPIGFSIDQRSLYYIVDEQAKVWLLQKGSVQAMRGHQPFLLSLTEGAYYPHLSGGLVLTEYALFAAVPGRGLFVMGNPQRLTQDRSYRPLHTHLYSYSNYRNDLDQLPLAREPKVLSHQIPTESEKRPISSPSLFFDPYQRKAYAVVTDSMGHILLYNMQGKCEVVLPVEAGKVYVSPILEDTGEQKVNIYILSANSLQSWQWDRKHQRISRIWERKEFGSKGCTFIYVDQSEGTRLFFIDERSYLTSLNADSGETVFRQPVDAWQFVYYPLYAQPYIFCGSKKIDAVSGKVMSQSFIRSSQSSIVGLAGRVYLFQMDELDLIAWDALKETIIWRVRKLWCKHYCFQQTPPAIFNQTYHGWAFLSDYHRLLCIDVLSGYIWWRKSFQNDFLLTAPTIAETQNQALVFVGSVYGRIYAFDARNGFEVESYPFQLPGNPSEKDEIKGCSTPVIINGCLLVNRLEQGLYIFGKEEENLRDFPEIVFKVSKASSTSDMIFNRAEIFWDGKAAYSNITRD